MIHGHRGKGWIPDADHEYLEQGSRERVGRLVNRRERGIGQGGGPCIVEASHHDVLRNLDAYRAKRLQKRNGKLIVPAHNRVRCRSTLQQRDDALHVVRLHVSDFEREARLLGCGAKSVPAV